jgi:hypothetical protein
MRELSLARIKRSSGTVAGDHNAKQDGWLNKQKPDAVMMDFRRRTPDG